MHSGPEKLEQLQLAASKFNPSLPFSSGHGRLLGLLNFGHLAASRFDQSLPFSRGHGPAACALVIEIRELLAWGCLKRFQLHRSDRMQFHASCHGNGRNGGKNFYLGGEFLTAMTLAVLHSRFRVPVGTSSSPPCSYTVLSLIPRTAATSRAVM